MFTQIQEFMTEQTQAFAGQAQKFREDPVETVREAAVTSAEGIKSLKQPVRVIARSGVDLLQDQAEALKATRDRLVDEAGRAMAIFKHAGRDVAKVASQAYAKVVETDEEETPAPATTRARQAKRPVRKAARKTTARARKVA